MRVGAVIAAAGKSGGYKSYDKMKSVDGIQVLRQMILNFKRAGVDEIVLITGYQAEQVEKKLAKLGAVFLRSEDYEKEEMITSAVRGMNYLKPRCEKFFFCPAGVSLFTEDTVRVLMQKAKENENDQEKVYVPVWEERKGHPILMDRSMIDQFASYEGEGGLKGAMDALNVERIFVPVEDNGVAIYSGQGEQTTLKQIGDQAISDDVDAIIPVATLAAQVMTSCEKELGYTVVERSPGGKHGGVASVSEAGKDILRKYELLEKDVAKYAEKRYKDIFES